MTKFLMLAAAAILPAASAQAVTITFEGFNNQQYDAPITRSGYLIGNPAGDEQHFHEITSTSFGLPNNGTGVLLNDRDTRIFVQDAASATTAFTLGSVDVAAASGNSPAVGLTITGFLNNVQTGVITIASLGSGYTTVAGGTLGNVDRLIFDGIGGGGGFVLDNLTLNAAGNAVPEPATWAMMIGGFGLAGAAMRRRRTTVSFA